MGHLRRVEKSTGFNAIGYQKYQKYSLWRELWLALTHSLTRHSTDINLVFPQTMTCVQRAAHMVEATLDKTAKSTQKRSR